MGATEGRSQMCHWSKVMKRLLAPCSHPYLLVSEGLFEKQDKYSPSPWQIFFILVTTMTFIAPRNAADALQSRGIAVHRRERGLCELKSKVFAETVKTYGFLTGRLQSTGTRRQQGSVSHLTILRQALLFFLFACFTVLHFYITRCATGQSFEDCAARKGSHLPFQLSRVRRGSWGIRWQHYYICQFQSFLHRFPHCKPFLYVAIKKKLCCEVKPIAALF